MSDPDRVADLLVAFRAADLHLEELSVQQPTLDEVFLTLTGSPAHDGEDGSPSHPDAGAPDAGQPTDTSREEMAS
jgi:ABC-2 type transport system ATP-binding protein